MNRLYRRELADVEYIINRCDFDADCGRVELSLRRIADLKAEFPGNPHALYAEGLIRRDFLGEGIRSFESFQRSFEAAARAAKRQTRWFSLCNMATLAPTEEEFRRLVAVAVREFDSQAPEVVHWTKLIERLDGGASYAEIVFSEIHGLIQSSDNGAAAARFESLLSLGLNGEDVLEGRKSRAQLLRELDRRIETARPADSLSPYERLALQEAVREMTEARTLDEYDATIWNYLSGWSVLLRRYDDGVAFADQAIRLRPEGYHRPWQNKAFALHEAGRKSEAEACARRLIDMLASAPSSPSDLDQAKKLLDAIQRSPESDMEFAARVSALVLEQALRTADRWQQHGDAAVTIRTIADRLLAHETRVRGNPIAGYVPLAAELLNDIPPEAAYLATLDARRRRQVVAEYLVGGAVYVAAHGAEIERRDAARYLALIALSEGPGLAKMRTFCRRSFTAIAEAGGAGWQPLLQAMRFEFSSIHPRLVEALFQGEPATAAELDEARRNVLKSLEDVRGPFTAGTAVGAGPFPIDAAAGGCIAWLFVLSGIASLAAWWFSMPAYVWGPLCVLSALALFGGFHRARGGQRTS